MRSLNIGCGNDFSCTDRIDKYPSKATTMTADVEDGLPYPNNTFDEVYARSLFEHLKDPHKLLLEMKRVCKVGGTIKVITDNAGFVLFHHTPSGWKHGDYFWTNAGDKHYALYTEEHLRNHFQEAGLKITKQYYSSIYSLGEAPEMPKFRKIYKITAQFLLKILGKRWGYPWVCIEGIK